jgi:hypothetical protein
MLDLHSHLAFICCFPLNFVLPIHDTSVNLCLSCHHYILPQLFFIRHFSKNFDGVLCINPCLLAHTSFCFTIYYYFVFFMNNIRFLLLLLLVILFLFLDRMSSCCSLFMFAVCSCAYLISRDSLFARLFHIISNVAPVDFNAVRLIVYIMHLPAFRIGTLCEGLGTEATGSPISHKAFLQHLLPLFFIYHFIMIRRRSYYFLNFII